MRAPCTTDQRCALGTAQVEKRFHAFMDPPRATGSPTDRAGGPASVDVSSTALCDAASRGDISALAAIAAAGGDVNLGDYDRRTAIHLAASEGLLTVVQYLVDELGANHSPVGLQRHAPAARMGPGARRARRQQSTLTAPVRGTCCTRRWTVCSTRRSTTRCGTTTRPSSSS